MFFNSLILAISSSVDALGIGITYGIKKTKIILFAKIILFTISFTITMLSLWFGDILKNFLSYELAKFIGSFILICMGCFIFFQALKKDFSKDCFDDIDNNYKINSGINSGIDSGIDSEIKIYSFFIKFLGITIKIIKNPNSSDLDSSNYIDSKEAIFLGIALSLDCIGIGVGGSIVGINPILFPFLVSSLQLLFLNLGIVFGKKIDKIANFPDNLWAIISGLLLCIIGVIKFFI